MAILQISPTICSSGVHGDFSLDGGGTESGEGEVICGEGQVATSGGSSCGELGSHSTDMRPGPAINF